MSVVESFTSVLMGEETLLVRCAELLLERGHQIQAIIAANPALRHWATAHQIAVIEPTDDLAEPLRERPHDYFFSITNLAIVPNAVLSLARRAAINFHDGPLPQYAGLYVTSWALMNREATHGITWHLMGERVDEGDILKQVMFDVDPDATAFSLNTRCYEAAAESFAELLDDLAGGTLCAVRQDLAHHTYFGRAQRPVKAAALCWQQPAEALSALVRALDFGPYPNPLALPKLLDGQDAFLVGALTVMTRQSLTTPGTITGLTGTSLQVATSNLDVQLDRLMTVDGQPVELATLAAQRGWRPGYRFAPIGETVAEELTRLNQRLGRHEEHWRLRLAEAVGVDLPYGQRGQPLADIDAVALHTATLPATPSAMTTSAADWLLAALALYLARLSGSERFDLAFQEPALVQAVAGAEHLVADRVPLRVTVTPSASLATNLCTILSELARARRAVSFARDLIARAPSLRALRESGGRLSLPVGIERGRRPAEATLPTGMDLRVLIDDDGQTTHWLYRQAAFQPAEITAMQQQLTAFVASLLVNPERSLAETMLLTDMERQQVLVTWNDTVRQYPSEALVHELIREQAARTPEAVAVVFGHDQLTYQQLDERADRLATYLRALGVGPDGLVGVFVERSLEMVVGLLGILKAGAAYVPLDPVFPRERLAFMVEDAGLSAVLTQERLLERLPTSAAAVVCLDRDWPAIATAAAVQPVTTTSPLSPAYVIYTSGSTGRPKGVKVVHRNVVNFFAGMDDRLDFDGTPGVWLAVTSISFDISVLELLWTLARGFKVVVQADADRVATVAQGSGPASRQPIDFSLFYFSSAGGEQAEAAADKYQLLTEGARFADRHGFSAVWTPERHFHEFGGLYPNPAVISAALATITERLQLRAGSVVLPLHQTLRVAEEWSVVDNLSRGRVGVSFTNGWIADDFVLAPDSFARRKELMHEQIAAIQALWRGETLTVPNGVGQAIPVRIFPRPLQPTLPMWLTAAGAPETFRAAGALGAHLLTHLLGQSIDELITKIALYRQARAEHGHDPTTGIVTVMLHAFIGDDLEAVRNVVRRPLIDYLKSSSGLVRTLARSLDHQFADGDLSDADMEHFLEARFDRYFETSGLMGTLASCLATVERLKAAGVNEIACLVDFGIDPSTVLAGLPRLAELHQLANQTPPAVAEDFSLPAQIQRHGVTHFQCTPSMASMVAMDPVSLASLRPLRHLLVGGEALPPGLATTLAHAVDGAVTNMYGPTETTVWSTTQRVTGDGRAVPVGRPIANTAIYILDRYGQPTPPGVPGELCIGGDGVTAGYLNRPELTAERFVPDRFAQTAGARLYRTGDLARYRSDGIIEFLGRIDYQVKVRGYRIELGEIEALLVQQATVQEAVVVAREEGAGDTRLVGYVIPAAGHQPAGPELRNHLKQQLPDYMVPSSIVVLERFPLTPNGKIDRKRLPAPQQSGGAQPTAAQRPVSAIEETIAAIWQTALRVDSVSVTDNLFDLGAHSLLMLQVSGHIKERLGRTITLVELFRFPTVRLLAQHLEQSVSASPTTPPLHSPRGQLRREAVALRSQARLTLRPIRP